MVDRRVTQEGLEVDVLLDDPTLRITQEGLEVDVNLDDPTLRVTQVGLEVDSLGGGSTCVSQVVYEVAIWRTPGLNVAQLLYEAPVDTGNRYPVQVSQLVYEVAIYIPPLVNPYYDLLIPTKYQSLHLPIGVFRPNVGG